MRLMFHLFFAVLLISINSLAFASSDNISNFVVINDLHFNPFTACQPGTGPHVCPTIEDLQNAPPSEWDSILKNNRADEPMTAIGQDPNYKLVTSALNELQASIQIQHPDFVVYLGDFLGHHFDGDQQAPYKHLGFYYYADNPTQARYQQFVKKTMEYLVDKIKAKSQGLSVYFLLGNNDSYYTDNVSNPNGAFYNDMNTLFEVNQSTFQYAGYYAQNIGKNGAILMLNSNLFSPNAVLPSGLAPTTAATDELKWLGNELAAAQLQNRQVWIMMHIPPGIDSFSTQMDTHSQGRLVVNEQWSSNYLTQFVALINTYHNIVKGIFAAHAHKDAFSLLKNKDGNDSVVNINPAISPNYDNNAAFKVVYYDNSTFEPKNYDIYYLNLTTPSTWKVEYNFDLAYKMSGDLRKNYQTLANSSEMKSVTGKYAKLYQQYFAANYPYSTITDNWSIYYCSMITLTNSDFTNCYNSMPSESRRAPNQVQ